jgi:hypothetical protein
MSTLTAADIAELEILLEAKKPDGTPLASKEELEHIRGLLRKKKEFDKKHPWAIYREDPIGYFYNVLEVKMMAPNISRYRTFPGASRR